jgi:carboxyl-terminal processing protease
MTSFAFAGGAWFAESSRATTREESPYGELGQLGRVMVLIENQYVTPVDHRQVVQGAIKGMVHELDPHSTYMTAEEFRVFQSDTEGRFGGIGVEVDLRDETITIIAPIEGSPAERAGILPGDRIVAIDGRGARGEPLEKLVRKLRGAPGTKVRLSVRRASHDVPLTFELVREQIRVASVVARRMRSDVLYIRLKQFQEGTHDELLLRVAELRRASAAPFKAIVLDMRTNPGGLVDEASELADEFLQAGTIYSTRHRGAVVDEVTARHGGALVDGPMAVLVNQYSASAAELVAGSLQDNGRATIVGNATFGKGSVQSIVELPAGAGIKLTTMRYYTPKGRSIQAAGISPDIVVETKTGAPDPFEFTYERDLEGHLPAEGPPAAKPRAVYRAPVAAVTAAGAGQGVTLPRTAADVPADPSSASAGDYALSIAYGTVLEEAARKTSTPPRR